eukprot:m.104319 g.104319  ORF g.104319 m.104319 type:complete len:1038 (+) comp10522_c1_seq2:78-3191(+)
MAPHGNSAGNNLHAHLVLMSKYNTWASSTLLSVISESLSEEQVTQTPSHGQSLRTELEELYVACATWYARLSGNAEDDILQRLQGRVSDRNDANANAPEPVTTSELVDAIKTQCSDYINFVSQLSFSAINSTFTYSEDSENGATDSAAPTETTAAEDDEAAAEDADGDGNNSGTMQTAGTGYTLVHVLNDATFRRGRMSVILASLGVEMPATSMRDFLPTEDSLEVDQRWHALLDFRSLLKQFSAITTTRADGSDMIKLHGPAADVAKCKAFLQAQAAKLEANYAEEAIEFDSRLHHVAAGPGGSVFSKFLAGTALAVIECTSASSGPDGVITIRGLPDAVKTIAAQVRQRVAELSEPGQTALATITPDFRTSFDTDMEKIVADVLSATGAKLELDVSATTAAPSASGGDSDDGAPVEPPSSRLSITGTRGEVLAAEAMLTRLQGVGSADEPTPSPFQGSFAFFPGGESGVLGGPLSDSELILEVHAPEEYHRFLIGARGATMKQIQNESGALIFFPNTKNAPVRVKPSSENVVTIVGSKEACDRAQALVLARIHDCVSDTGTGKDSAYLKLLRTRSPRQQRNSMGQHFPGDVQVHVPSELHGFVVGGRGFVLKEIQTESGARVFLPTTKTAPARARSAGKDVITIVGSQRACDIARSLVLARADDAENGRRSKEDSAYMALLSELRERGQTASSAKGNDGRKHGSMDAAEMNHMHEMMMMNSQIRPRIQDGEHFYIPTHGPTNAAMLHAMSVQVGESQGQYIEPGVLAQMNVDQQFVHHEGMPMHPHRHPLPIDARHNPWSDPMQQQGMNGHPHPHAHAMSHEQMVAAQAAQAEAAAQHNSASPQQAPPWSENDPPPTSWPSATGDELGAAAAWSAAPGHASLGHENFMQDPGMQHHHFAPHHNQMIADALYSQIMRDRQVRNEEIPGIVDLLNAMPMEGLQKCLEDPSYRHRMVQRCLQMQQHQRGTQPMHPGSPSPPPGVATNAQASGQLPAMASPTSPRSSKSPKQTSPTATNAPEFAPAAVGSPTTPSASAE